jgi:hypothetical protein
MSMSESAESVKVFSKKAHLPRLLVFLPLAGAAWLLAPTTIGGLSVAILVLVIGATLALIYITPSVSFLDDGSLKCGVRTPIDPTALTRCMYGHFVPLGRGFALNAFAFYARPLPANRKHVWSLGKPDGFVTSLGWSRPERVALVSELESWLATTNAVIDSRAQARLDQLVRK